MKWIAFRARIIRMWKIPSEVDPRDFSSVHIILMNHLGDKIEASVVGPSITFFLRYLHEDCVYDLGLFDLLDNDGAYRSTSHNHCLRILFNTGLNQVSDKGFPREVFRNDLFDEVIRTNVDADSLTSCIGVLSAVAKERFYVHNNQRRNLFAIELCDEYGSYDCLLFDEHALHFRSFLSRNRAAQTVVVLQFVKINFYRGRVVLYAKGPATKLMFNPKGTDILKFRLRMQYIGICCSRATVASIASQNSFEGQLLGDCPPVTIEKLKDVQPGIYLVHASIVGITSNMSCFYDECSCKCPIFKEYGDYCCRVCGMSDGQVTKRYKIPVVVADASACLPMSLLDRDARALLNSSCAEVYGSISNFAVECSYPKILDKLVGGNYKMKIEVTKVFARRGLNRFIRRLTCQVGYVNGLSMLPSDDFCIPCGNQTNAANILGKRVICEGESSAGPNSSAKCCKLSLFVDEDDWDA
ncbi:hypothetical protein RIF29_25457 [Crotalaria pallida]|uniref:Replication protein A 70 kDa DNA-binding subunit B/D first OB fold domain-containing protein n=1 Tax=Crotalaria pallida TaxID=3830 RepID=A0AAN9EM72_CROPI